MFDGGGAIQEVKVMVESKQQVTARDRESEMSPKEEEVAEETEERRCVGLMIPVRLP